mmetsp:Transcript_23552/g.20459  ORF Transcript_23552/g.20459 Transcript_23552/m.20459 type:complete len:140 (-) Transcript_23552:109-528(-)|eukprot:CAMPEP_0114595736 /NCGR_PEP_ID=MMETSP0125-20121206/17635_1 /TAXON_ID=485358 ORGANISM="Aristerostoma sp., Strain ATCC 50986" /NCGR_SAMPLE_ID=MMETSP0125 /ASSEMBLY_ACC=CAM_ASM_000245 /LENGTH=139 /DNA_ID=CAMNT_0001797823 /DNA_START=6226 /DNA_END=6645 /DNA_ORIENTATION=+
MTGILDAASKTAEGLKNMTSNNDELLFALRDRVPRILYGKHRYYKQYIPYDSELYLALINDKEFEKLRFNYVDAYPMSIGKDSKDSKNCLFLVIFSEGLGIFSNKTAKFVWVADYREIDKVELGPFFINFIFTRDIARI